MIKTEDGRMFVSAGDAPPTAPELMLVLAHLLLRSAGATAMWAAPTARGAGIYVKTEDGAEKIVVESDSKELIAAVLRSFAGMIERVVHDGRDGRDVKTCDGGDDE